MACSAAAPVDPPPDGPGSHFVDVTRWAHAEHTARFPTGPGTALFDGNLATGAVAEDLDGDGHLDLYVGNPGGPKSLFWNDGAGRFSEGAAAAGIAYPEDFTHAIGAGDIDNDGDQDLYVLNSGDDRLLLNHGDRTFEDIAAAAGVLSPGAGLCVQFGDLDNDGVLDLFVGHMDTEQFEAVGSGTKQETTWALSQSHLYKGLGDGRFEDKTTQVGLALGNPFLGAMIDLDADGDLELYLLQDALGRVKNVLLENQGSDGKGFAKLVDVSKTCGCELPQGPMGLAVLDLDGNDLPDLFISNNYSSPPNREVMYLNRGGLVLQDITEEIGALPMDPWGDGGRATSWATIALDVGNDTLEDIFIVYGGLVGSKFGKFDDPKDKAEQADALLLRGFDGKYTVAEGTGLEDFARGHAALPADFDEDGCEDIYLVNLDAPSRLYRNRCAGAGHHVVLRLVGTKSNRDAIGARVRIDSDGRSQWRQVLGCSTSVHSCAPKRLHVGLGGAGRVDTVEIRWPSGAVQIVKDLAVDTTHVIVEP